MRSHGRLVGALTVSAMVLAGIGIAGMLSSGAGTNSPLLGALPSATAVRNFFGPQYAKTTTVVLTPGIPQGMLTAKGVLAVLGHNGIYQSAFQQAHGGKGANVAYRVTTFGTLYSTDDFLAIKFPTETAGRTFAEKYLNTLTTVGGAQVAENHWNTSLGFGVLPTNERVIYKVPSSPLGDTLGPTFIEQSLYSDGTYYLVIGAIAANGGTDVINVGGYAQLIDVTYKLCVEHPSSCPKGAGG